MKLFTNSDLILWCFLGTIFFIITIYDLKHNSIIKGCSKISITIIISILSISIILERLRYGFSYILILHLFLIYILIILSVYDFKEKYLPIQWLILGGIVGFLGLLNNPDISFLEGSLTATISILIIGSLTKLTRGGIGIGDGIVMASIGLFLGWQLTFSIFIFSLLLCSVWGIGLVLLKKAHKKSMIPLIPFILVATCTLLWI